MELVSGRQCGECTVCCVTPHIDTSEFKKLPGVRCPHLCSSGCSIYESRPSVCRSYHCGWRYLPFLSDPWRPDRSGVLLAFTPKNELPAGYASGVSFILVGQPPAPLTRALYHYVGHLITDGVHVMLAVAGPPEHYPVVRILNDELKEAALNRDHARIEAVFAEALALRNAPPERFPRVVPTAVMSPRS